MTHEETHKSHNVGWLRAAVLGANDGIVSTASLIIGVAASGTEQQAIILAGIAGLVAGAMSMAAGEYVSVSSQADTEFADIAQEELSLKSNFPIEIRELATIYEERGLDSELAIVVANQLMKKNALEAHIRDEIGITPTARAMPLQAAIYSAATFTLGAALPMVAAWLVPVDRLIPVVSLLSLTFLAILGGGAAFIGGASISRGSLRVTFWGALAMGLTAGVGYSFGIVA